MTHELKVIYRGSNQTAEWTCTCGYTQTVTAYSKDHAADQIHERHPEGDWQKFVGPSHPILHSIR